MTRLRWGRWAPLLMLAGMVAACQAVTGDPTPPPGLEPAPTEARASCDDSAIRLVDRGAGIHGAIVTDTLHMGGATASVTCTEPATQSLAGLPGGRAEQQTPQSLYSLMVIRYPLFTWLYILSRRADGDTCIVDTSAECVAEVSDLPDDFDVKKDLPGDVEPVIPAGRDASGTPVATDTAPGAAANPQPRDGATGVTVDAPLLSWSNDPRAVSYDVYWGTKRALDPDAALGTPHNTAATAVSIQRPGATAAEQKLAVKTTYYWRVDAKNDRGTTKGDVWSFTTIEPPYVVENPQPRDGATGVTVDAPRLSWSASPLAASYDVYWGTTRALDADAALGTPHNTAATAVTIQRPGATAAERRLAGETTYYWRVDPRNDAGATPGVVWSFTTGAAPPPGATPPPPAETPPPPPAEPPSPPAEPPPAPSVSIADASFPEGNGRLVTQQGYTTPIWEPTTTRYSVEVTLSAPARQELNNWVSYRLIKGTARKSSDYLGLGGTNRRFAFRPGTTSHSLSVYLVGDLDKEGDETFHVHLNPLGMTCGRCGATITIVDDD